MTSQCVLCSTPCRDIICLKCNRMNRDRKFAQLLLAFEKCSESVLYYDEIVTLVRQIRQVSFLEYHLHYQESLEGRINHGTTN